MEVMRSESNKDALTNSALDLSPGNDQSTISTAERQLADSRRHLARSLKNGEMKIHALHSERKRKEEMRRMKEEEMRQELRVKLLAEAEDSAHKNASVAMNWADLFAIEVPQDLLCSIEQQKILCRQIMESKDNLISDLKARVMKKDEDYVALLKRQSEETASLLEFLRIQEADAKTAYQSELRDIENAFLQEKKMMTNETSEKLGMARDKRNQLELEYMERFVNTAGEYERMLTELRLNDNEEYNALKVKLETDIQTLEQHLETMRATYQLNAEKLEYNYRVLAERDSENSTTINQQKRKLSKQRDVLCGLTMKHFQLEKNFQSENQKLTDEYRRIAEHFNELQLKVETTERHELTKFEQLWRMKEERIFALVRKLLDADRIIHEELLGWLWVPPNESVFRFEIKNSGSDARSNLDSSTMGESRDSGIDDEVRDYIDSGMHHAALSLICDEAGFLLDEKANDLIESVPVSEQGYVRAEEVVRALGVRDASAFEALVEAITSDDGEGNKKGSDSDGEDNHSRRPNDDLTALGQSDNLVHQNTVLRRLRTFIENEIWPQTATAAFRTKTNRRMGRTNGISRRALRKEAQFWERLSNSVNTDTYQSWRALQRHMEEYHQILKRRSDCLAQVKELRRQNNQLKHLLNQYLSSKVNEELVVPPVQTL